MALTKTTYSMINAAPFNVLDYSGLAETVSAKDPEDADSHLLSSFLCWNKPIQAALDAANAAGGGTVVLPKNSVPYYVTDEVVVYGNTTFVFEDWIILADYNLVGHTLRLTGDNIRVVNPLINNSGIYAGGSGYNGIWPSSGAGIKITGGYIKNCARGNVAPKDGGKGIQIEAGNSYDISVDGVTFENCFMAMSTIRDYTVSNPYNGIVYSNIIAFDCLILFFVKQSNGAQSPTGLQHTVQLNNFYAKNCGAFEGVIQLSRASNVLVSNGIVVNDPGSVTTSLIRGNHSNCQFVNIGFYGNAPAVVQLDPTTYAVDSSQPNENNRYDIQVWGQIDVLLNANVSTTYATLNNCFGSIQCRLDPTTAWIGYELRNGNSVFEFSQGQKLYRAVTTLNFYGNAYWPESFADMNTYESFLTATGLNAKYANFRAIASSAAPNNTLFIDSANNKLSFKDNLGAVNALY